VSWDAATDQLIERATWLWASPSPERARSDDGSAAAAGATEGRAGTVGWAGVAEFHRVGRRYGRGSLRWCHHGSFVLLGDFIASDSLAVSIHEIAWPIRQIGEIPEEFHPFGLVSMSHIASIK